MQIRKCVLIEMFSLVLIGMFSPFFHIIGSRIGAFGLFPFLDAVCLFNFGGTRRQNAARRMDRAARTRWARRARRARRAQAVAGSRGRGRAAPPGTRRCPVVAPAPPPGGRPRRRRPSPGPRLRRRRRVRAGLSPGCLGPVRSWVEPGPWAAKSSLLGSIHAAPPARRSPVHASRRVLSACPAKIEETHCIQKWK